MMKKKSICSSDHTNYDTVKKLLSETGVLPIINYCSGIWGYNDIEGINNAQN